MADNYTGNKFIKEPDGLELTENQNWFSTEPLTQCCPLFNPPRKRAVQLMKLYLDSNGKAEKRKVIAIGAASTVFHTDTGAYTLRVTTPEKLYRKSGLDCFIMNIIKASISGKKLRSFADFVVGN